MKFQKCTKESVVYRREEGETLLIVVIYVDDLFVTRNTLKVINDFKAGMSTKFEMSDLGKHTYYLGIEVHQGEDGIKIKQEGYAKKILREAGLESCNPTKVPMEFGLKVSKAEDEEEIDPTRYRRNVGCLRYLLHTRPDLAFVVGVASRYMQSPQKSHGVMMKHILRYLKGTVAYGLKYNRGGSKTFVREVQLANDKLLESGGSRQYREIPLAVTCESGYGGSPEGTGGSLDTHNSKDCSPEGGRGDGGSPGTKISRVRPEGETVLLKDGGSETEIGMA
ncbi:PREDICTED: uncharacterized protein LOC109131195 [Camelina sativa]|uniref:Uncharacterized protein LOC109131195 n=1 Tax=Camelina sativa TaxID=90675 RepID=A0ABM1REI9_CAMSA|nr:PREDICTED: uncharacterized protein LOC109131195 [Camelina sativa]